MSTVIGVVACHRYNSKVHKGHKVPHVTESKESNCEIYGSSEMTTIERRTLVKAKQSRHIEIV